MNIVKQSIYIAKPSKQDELKKALFILVLNIKRAKGCINFEVYEAEDEPSEFLLYEEWADKDSFEAYKESSEFKKFLEIKSDIVKRVEVLPEL